MDRTVVVVGVGPALGTALARTFADAGDRVALLARSSDRIESLAGEIRDAGGDAVGVTADVTDPDSVAAAFGAVRDAFGPVDVLVHNANSPGAGDLLDVGTGADDTGAADGTGVDDTEAAGGTGGDGGRPDPPSGDPAAAAEAFADVWRVRTQGGFLCVREALPDLLDAGSGESTGNHGTVLFAGTTLAFDGSARLPDWGSAAFATRGLAKSLARRFGPEGVHVAYVAVGGALAPADGYVTEDRADPAAVADAFLDLADQAPDAWTHELDLRPSNRPP